jgi:hypothetical protein
MQPDIMLQLKSYVDAPASGMQHRSESTVLLNVSHSNLSSRFMEIRLDLHVKPGNPLPCIAAFLPPPEELYIFGASAASQLCARR